MQQLIKFITRSLDSGNKVGFFIDGDISLLGKVGIVLATGWFEAQTTSADNLLAADRAREFSLGWFANPIFKGDYPEVMKQYVGDRSAAEGELRSRLPEFTAEEKFLLKGGLYGNLFNKGRTLCSNSYPSFSGRCADWLGINYYYSFNVSVRTDFSKFNLPLEEYDGGFIRAVIAPYAPGIRKLLNFASKTYGIPIMITENGLNLGDAQDSLNDQNRILYIRAHIVEILKGRRFFERKRLAI